MSEERRPPTEVPLESWKAISAHLNRDVRTVMRWEQTEGLPVHRHRHLARSSVYAFPSELDAWRAKRRIEVSQLPRGVLTPRIRAMVLVPALTLAVMSAGGGRLTGAPPPQDKGPTMTTRLVWTGDIGGTISDDGRRLAYINWWSTHLAMRDLQTNVERPLTTIGGAGGRPVISGDGAHVAYQWFNAGTQRYELRAIDLSSAGVPPSRLLFDADDVQWIAPLDWSPDGAWVAVKIGRKDKTAQIAIVNSRDRSLRVLKTVDWRGPSQLLFSPDGRFLAYDLPVKDGQAERDVFVIATDGTSETTLVPHPSDDRLMGWTPDGAQVLFTSDRNGSIDLFALRFSRSTDRDAPVLIKTDIGDVVPQGVTNAAALYIETRVSERDIEVASVDLDTGRRIAPSVRPIQRFVGSNSEPAWSPDGRLLAYRSSRPHESDGQILSIRSLDTDRTRDLHVKLRNFRHPTWAPDGKTLAAGGVDLKGRRGVFRIDATTGEVAPIVLPPGDALSMLLSFPQWSPDGQRLYYTDSDGVIQERDLTSGRDRVVFRSAPARPMHLSPDGRWIALQVSGGVTLVPVKGGTPQELRRIGPSQNLSGHMTWAPGSRAIIVRNMVPGGVSDASELWLVPTANGLPRKLDIDVSAMVEGSYGGFRLHPDGKRLAFLSGKSRTEVWALENFLPAAKR